jgi:hypothetical protein
MRGLVRTYVADTLENFVTGVKVVVFVGGSLLIYEQYDALQIAPTDEVLSANGKCSAVAKQLEVKNQTVTRSDLATIVSDCQALALQKSATQKMQER